MAAFNEYFLSGDDLKSIKAVFFVLAIVLRLLKIATNNRD